MKTFRFKGLLQNEGWLQPAFVRCDDRGIIENISDLAPTENKVESIEGFALPGFQNAHSHAFQYAMAGLAETHTSTLALKDNFWSWREAMYQVALSIDPDQLEAIAARLYAEMVRHGYSHVAEFHYLHHDPEGKPYHNKAELAEKLISAAQIAGINITLIPVFYQKGGFGKEPGGKQKRFICRDRFAYFDLWQATEVLCQRYSHASIALGIHSLRAVEPDEVQATLKEARPGIPVHIHVAEQMLEVEQALKFLKQRPVEWLAEKIGLGENFHLVHATHLTDKEIKSITDARANVVLCPSTEGNLGDGVFAFEKFHQNNGRWSIGTDSHIGLNPFEELRWLDYGQRLTTHNRNTFQPSPIQNSEASPIEPCIRFGRKAMGSEEQPFFRNGTPLNALVIDASNPLISATSFKNLTSTIVYTSDPTFNLGTIINGKWVVERNRHVAMEDIDRIFREAMNGLRLR